ncbi:hypothetical protein OIU85_028597 [Salix viminalis]|uniref:Uncharacterized protein n=1 Tax=Salix viminalis TaxID=40686 RepID=A0A9Q0TC59_SALVM|nr:hypothetical protein OIU85_028597 [Salix viminalis]
MVGQELCPEQLNSPVAADDSLFTNTSPPVLSNFERFTYSQIDWVCYECILHPPSGNHSTRLQFNNFNAWIRKLTRNSHQESDELVLIIPSDANYTQGFSVFLSSNRQSKLNDAQFAEAYESECLESKNRISKELHHDSKVSRASYLCPLPIPSILSKTCGKSSPGNATNVQNTGRLGPFTGYSTALK